MSANTLVNGVDVAELHGLAAKVEAHPENALVQFRVRNRWIDGAHTRSRVKDVAGLGEEAGLRAKPFVVESDEPASLGGADRAPTPVEYALHALAGCLTASLVYHAALGGVQVEEVDSFIEGTLNLRGFLGMDHEVRSGFNLISVRFTVKADATDEKLRALVEQAQNCSPVMDIMSNGVSISVSLESN